MASTFTYRMATWMPFQDQAACERARALTSNDLANYKHPNLKITILRDDEFAFRLVNDIFGVIKQARDEGRRLVLILPQT